MVIDFIKNLLRTSLYNLNNSAIHKVHICRNNVHTVLSAAFVYIQNPITSMRSLYLTSLDAIKVKIQIIYSFLINARLTLLSDIVFVSLLLRLIAFASDEYVVHRPLAVSGFYGPGAYAAWYIAVILKMAESLHHRAKHRLNGWQKPDFDTLTAIAYPLIALVDAEIKSIVHDPAKVTTQSCSLRRTHSVLPSSYSLSSASSIVDLHIRER